jgi:hypothetical protein
VHTYRRLRLISPQDAEADSDIRSLRSKVDAIPERQKAGPLDLEDAAVTVLAGRIIETQLVRSTSGWRLTLPRNIVELWGIKPGHNDAVVLFSGGYIEIWSVEELKEAYSVSLKDLA